jgi:tRNA threonylcarbamoyl adenosine modification protein (Sua5/YciO/YrdC/YwlC family)
MEIVSKNEFEVNLHNFIKRIVEGQIFVYGTDTIYGIGCDATNSSAVERIRTIKSRQTNPFSVIAPSKEWIVENCQQTSELNKLPGPYTLIVKLKNKECIAEQVNSGKDTLGVRIPNHWFSAVVQEIGLPIVTTSVNKTGEPFMTAIEELDPALSHLIDFAIDEGKINGKPSTIIDVTQTKNKVIKR